MRGLPFDFCFNVVTVEIYSRPVHIQLFNKEI